MTACARRSSYQLPDFLSFIRTFELRTSHHCRAVSTASEQWVLPAICTLSLTAGGKEQEGDGESPMDVVRARVRGARVGLLAALCFPTVDAPQLRIISDFLSILLLSDGHILRDTKHPLREDFGMRLPRNCAPPKTFAQHYDVFLEAHTTQTARLETTPDLESYIELRRELCGLRMVFDLIGWANGFKHVGVEQTSVDREVERLCKNAIDIIAWSWDILSYHTLQLAPHTHNIVAVLMTEKSLCLQAAVQLAGSLVRQNIAAFVENELSLFLLLDELICQADGEEAEIQAEVLVDEARAYARGLRDCITGALNWAYESEMWMGEKGDEVREFGWIFL